MKKQFWVFTTNDRLCHSEFGNSMDKNKKATTLSPQFSTLNFQLNGGKEDETRKQCNICNVCHFLQYKTH